MVQVIRTGPCSQPFVMPVTNSKNNKWICCYFYYLPRQMCWFRPRCVFTGIKINDIKQYIKKWVLVSNMLLIYEITYFSKECISKLFMEMYSVLSQSHINIYPSTGVHYLPYIGEYLYGPRNVIHTHKQLTYFPKDPLYYSTVILSQWYLVLLNLFPSYFKQSIFWENEIKSLKKAIATSNLHVLLHGVHTQHVKQVR